MSGVEDLVNMTYYQVQGEDVISFFPAHSLTWIFAVTLITAFISAFGIGANDVANSFATAIASKTLTLAKACIIAGLMEFLGAVLLSLKLHHLFSQYFGVFWDPRRHERLSDIVSKKMVAN